MLRTNELQVWFLSEHLVDVPLVRHGIASASRVRPEYEQSGQPFIPHEPEGEVKRGKESMPISNRND